MSYKKRNKALADINVIPYIDVMLVLLIVFMVTTPIIQQGINVELPKVESKPLEDELPPVIISINKSGQYFLSTHTKPKEILDKKNLFVAIKKIQNKNKIRSILIQGDKNTTYGKVISLMGELQKNNINNIGLITEDP